MRYKYKTSNLIIAVLLISFLAGVGFLVKGLSRFYAENEITIISTTKIKKLSAQEFVEILKEHRIISISYTEQKVATDQIKKDNIGVYIEGWPTEVDIIFLLSVVNSTDDCGIINNVFDSFLPIRMHTYSKVKTVSINLLKAIKENKLYPLAGFTELPAQERKEIIDWANSQISSVEGD